MICGIDLGTTNSLIGYGDTLYSGLVSSSVNIATKSQSPRDVVGDDIVSSYKVDMTTGTEGQLPIACSAVILRDLADKASMASGEVVNDIVVSVPAKFTHTQRQAVMQAAEKAGLNIHGLINEPTAAALYVCKDLKDLCIVYDLGGGTFDVTVIDTRAGNYYVVATDGRILAGDDFDEALVEKAYSDCNIKIRYRTKNKKKEFLAEMRIAKETLQKTGLSQIVDMTKYGYNGIWELTVDTYTSIMKSVFAETITMTCHLRQAYLDETEDPKIVFVGGSTACPFLRRWVQEETGLTAMSCDAPPDYIVAKGVALYAKMLEDGTAQREIDDVTKRLCFEDNRGMTITIIEKNTTIPVEETISLSNPVKADTLELNLYQGDFLLASENDYIGTLQYKYNSTKEAEEGWVDIKVTVDMNGIITIEGADMLTGISQSVKLIMS